MSVAFDRLVLLALAVAVAGTSTARQADEVSVFHGALTISEPSTELRGLLSRRELVPDDLPATTTHRTDATRRSVYLETPLGSVESFRPLDPASSDGWLLTESTQLLGQSMTVRLDLGPQETIVLSDDHGGSRREAWKGGYFHQLLFSEDHIGPLISAHYDRLQRLSRAHLGGRLEARFEYQPSASSEPPGAGHDSPKAQLESVTVVELGSEKALWRWSITEPGVFLDRKVEYLRAPTGSPLLVWDEALYPGGAIPVGVTAATYAWLSLSDGPVWRSVTVPQWNVHGGGLRVDYTEDQIRVVLWIGSESAILYHSRGAGS